MSAATEISTEILAKIPLFKQLAEEERQQLADIATVANFTPGELILRQGRSSQNLWIVISGQCEVVRHGDNGDQEEVVLATLAPYDNFGEMSFFHAAPHSAGVRGKTNVKLLRISREAFDTLLANGSVVAYKLAHNAVESLADRLRKMDEWVARLMRQKRENRSVREWSQFRESLFSEWSL